MDGEEFAPALAAQSKDDKWKDKIKEDFKDCTKHTRDVSVPETVGHRIRKLTRNVFDTPDIALAEWSRLKTDQFLPSAVEQLELEARATFCPSPAAKEWSKDVYDFFEELREAAKNQTNPAHEFAEVLLKSLPNLDPFLSCVCRHVFEPQRKDTVCPQPKQAER